MAGGNHIDSTDADLDPGRVLFELAPRLNRLLNGVLTSVSPPLTFRQYQLLERVGEGRNTATALGAHATITRPAVSESVEGLVRKGVLERSSNELDRRESHLALTPEGVDAIEQSRVLLKKTAAALLDGVPAERHALLAGDLLNVLDEVTGTLVRQRDRDRGSRFD